MSKKILPLSCPSFHCRNNLAGSGAALVSPPPGIVSSGIDTLYLSVAADVPEGVIEMLKEKKAEVQELADDHRYIQFGGTDLFSWNLQRTGTKFYPYVLKCGDFTVCLSSRKAESSIPSMQIVVGSISCNNDLPSLLIQFRRWCRHYGIKILADKVSRIDIYADTAYNIEDLRLFSQSRFVTRAEKVNLYYSNRRLSGLQVGAGDIVFRAYNKIQEMVDKCAGHKIEFFKSIWGDVEHVTRCEFQLRREAVKSICPGVSDIRSVVAKLPNIWRYLTESWFRQTAKAVDRQNRNQSRETTSEWWLVVQSAFDAPAHQAATRNKQQKHINTRALIEQAAGIMTTVCAAVGHAPDDLFGIMATAAKAIQDKIFEKYNEVGFGADFSSRVAAARITF